MEEYYNFKIVKYQLDSISINGLEAKAKMAIDIIENNEKDHDEYFDYWEYSNDNWYVSEFGRTE
jgi:hypothetical protein